VPLHCGMSLLMTKGRKRERRGKKMFIREDRAHWNDTRKMKKAIIPSAVLYFQFRLLLLLLLILFKKQLKFFPINFLILNAHFFVCLIRNMIRTISKRFKTHQPWNWFAIRYFCISKAINYCHLIWFWCVLWLFKSTEIYSNLIKISQC
jgi:hypothetical protein